jgi:hypothetical protein
VIPTAEATAIRVHQAVDCSSGHHQHLAPRPISRGTPCRFVLDAQILYLYAEMTSKKEYRSRMRAMEHIFESRGLMDYTVKFDGSDPEHKALRNS